MKNSMNRKQYAKACARRDAKFREIMTAITKRSGAPRDVDAQREAERAVVEWAERERESPPQVPKTALQRLLRQYHIICEELLDLH
jgi:hypothetical protein